jgi:glucose/arabinose dehydrogenase
MINFILAGSIALALQGAPSPCADAGLTLPQGFCAVQVGTGLGGVRQLTVSADGVLYAAIQEKGDGRGVLVFADTNRDGRMDRLGSFGPGGVNDVELHGGFLYAALPDRIVRWRVSRAAPVATGEGEVVISGMPAGGHGSKVMAFKGDSLFITFGSRTNSCQERDRQTRSPGVDPCTELQNRAGIWVFNASRAGQTVSDGMRYATGLRNAAAIAVQPGSGALYTAIMGRDQLGQNWGFSDSVNAEDPAEEFGVVSKGADYGWPYCYYANTAHAKVLAPEYGGDGKRTDRCTDRTMPAIAFPGHFAPLALVFYPADAFGAKYRNGAFVAFHGSWNRAPLPQSGYRVDFIPFASGKPTGKYESFASSSSGANDLRASGLAVAPDGALFIADDRAGTIWRVTRAGE